MEDKRQTGLIRQVDRTFDKITEKCGGDPKEFAKKMFLRKDGERDWESMAQFFTACDALVTILMRTGKYTEAAIDAVCRIIVMLAAAAPERYAKKNALPDKDSESIADPAAAYYRIRYSVAENYLHSKDEVVRRFAEDDLRGYMLSIEQELNDVIDMCDYALIEEERKEEYLE